MTDRPPPTPHTRPMPQAAALGDADLDELLRSAPDPAPPGFAEQVVLRLGPQRPAAAAAPPPWRRLADRIALLGAAALGMGQVLAFIFGLWAATATA